MTDVHWLAIASGAFLLGLLLSWFLFRWHQKDIQQIRTEGIEEGKRIAARESTLQFEKRIAQLQGAHQEELAKEKEIAYEEGRKDVQKDYLVVCTPFVKIHEGVWSQSMRAGYQYRLHVKGMPIFEPAEVVVRQENRIDEQAKQALLVVLTETIRAVGDRVVALGLPFQGEPPRELTE
jgi:hypothetical protein